jgi:riboflavin kinase/FMN adenylyltransferase
VVTFEPHAFEFFAKGPVTIPRITRLREKFTALAECGVDYVVVLKFNQELASIDASQFVSDILHQTLRPVHMIVGDDFRFGRERKGDFALLSKMGADLGFTVEAMPTLLVDGERVSSTRVRKALQAGHLAQAERLLGRPYAMLGRVCHGDKLGQKLGFPTANIYLHRRLTPVLGIYTVYMYGLSGNQQGWPGVANVGTRPTVDGTRTLLEVHLLNFNQDIYGRYVRVEYCQKLRDEERYPNLDLLKEQIARDVEAAIQYFKGGV